MSESTPKDLYKRKRKKSFLKNARKYAKKGHFGRGSQLDPDTYQYFVRILEAYREGFDSDEDKTTFVNNVFEQTQGQEITCSCNQVGCRVVEMLLPFANEATLERFFQVFGEDLRPLCSDRFASHVLETLVSQACNKLFKSKADDEFKEKCKEFVLKVSKFLLNNLEDYIWDTYGSHVIRTCLSCLSQSPPDDKPQKSAEEDLELPPEFIETVQDYGERILKWPQFSEFPNSEITSGFVQILLKVLKEVDKKLLKKYLKKLRDECFSVPEDDKTCLSGAFLSVPAMRVLERALQVAPSKIFTKIYLGCFKDRLVKLAVTRSTNFTVQKLIMNCQDKSEFEAIFDELSNSFKDIIASGHTGIIWALGQACKRLLAKQGTFVQNLMKSLDCFEPEESQNNFIFCLSKFSSLDGVKTKELQKEKLSLHGTLLLQLLLEFNKPIKIVNAILNMETSELQGLFSNTMGSHVVDSFVKSPFVGEKSREKLIKKMKGSYQELASTKFGSRSFEALWSAANLKSKLAIMEELAHKEGAWSNSEHGKIVASKINLALYKRNREEWKGSLNSTDKAKAMFEDILK